MRFKNPYGERELTVAEFAANELDGNYYDRGALESAEATANNVNDAFSRLLQVLADRHLLTKNEVHKIINNYDLKE